MYGIINFEVFLLTGILMNLIPGADTMYIVGRSISQGTRAGIYSVFGIITGSLVHTLFVACGLSIILTKSIVLFNTIKIIGVIYLVYLGIKMILDKSNIGFEASSNKLNLRKIYIQGLLTSLTNPKVSLFFLALLPQFVNPSNGHVGLQMLILGIVFLVQALILFSLISIFASKVRKVIIGKPAIAKRLNMVQGVLFTFIGIQIALSKQ